MTPPAWIAFGIFALVALCYAREVQIARRETPPGPPPIPNPPFTYEQLERDVHRIIAAQMLKTRRLS